MNPIQGVSHVAADVLQDLVTASRRPGADFEIAAVVTKPPGRDHSGGHVWKAAQQLEICPTRILAPASPKEPAFLHAIAALSPDLCVTAAYGGMLPQAFLDMPRCGTVNIHPSMLPRYRGPAPVQRSLAAGDAVAGVSLAYTILACDAGPVLEQRSFSLGGEEQAPEVTARLFQIGSDMLLARLGDILSGRGRDLAVPQDDSLAMYAPRLRAEEGAMDVRQSAEALHNKVRALAAWPGTHLDAVLTSVKTGEATPLKVRVLATRVVPPGDVPAVLARCDAEAAQRVHFAEGRMLLACGGSPASVLEVLEVKNPVQARPRHAELAETRLSGSKFMRRLGKQSRLLLPPPAA
ncbi:hypothetical protein FOA52_004942 [Chlamydomonas sp. UWO 241]|nr:hypothetical protein FOA52_004942 [Chlamydomonas sp. UWO 241]